MKRVYPTQVIQNAHKHAQVTFKEGCQSAPDALKITPMVFCFLGSSVVLSLDKTGEWNAQCGHRDGGESIEECLKREAYEEAGVEIHSPLEFGCMRYETFYNKKRRYPPVTYIPVFCAQVAKRMPLPGDSEVKRVVVVNHKKACTLLGARNDSQLLLSVYNGCREHYLPYVSTN